MAAGEVCGQRLQSAHRHLQAACPLDPTFGGGVTDERGPAPSQPAVRTAPQSTPEKPGPLAGDKNNNKKSERAGGPLRLLPCVYESQSLSHSPRKPRRLVLLLFELQPCLCSMPHNVVFTRLRPNPPQLQFFGFAAIANPASVVVKVGIVATAPTSLASRRALKIYHAALEGYRHSCCRHCVLRSIYETERQDDFDRADPVAYAA